MFQNRYLKQLKEVQAQIKMYNTLCEQLVNPPVPSEFKTGYNLFYWFEELFLGNKSSIPVVLDEEMCDYLHKLGEYFVNISKHWNTKLRYETKLRELELKEDDLKKKLGIY